MHSPSPGRPVTISWSSQILTKDSVTVYVNAVMYYRVADAESAVNNVDDYAESAKLIASTTLRNVLGTKTLGEILSDTDTIAEEIKSELDLATSPWGVLVERVEVKDVSVPQQLQRSLASVAEAQRESRAKVRQLDDNNLHQPPVPPITSTNLH